MLKLVTAVIKPQKFDDVKEALKASGVTGVTVTEVKGFGRQGGKTEVFRGSEYKVDLLPKLKLEIALADGRVDDAISAITHATRTGKIGDGKIFVLDLEQSLRVRTGETGDDSL